MTTTVKTVTRQFTPRSLADLDPKVAIGALVTLLAWVTLIVLFVLGKIDGTTLITGGGPASLVTLLGYLKTSSHRQIVFEAERAIDEAEALAPAVEAVLPAAKPVVEEAEGILSSIGLAPAAATEVLPAPLVATGTLTLSATGGGQ